MDRKEIIFEISEILMLEGEFDLDKTQIEFDSLTSLMLIEFLDSNFSIGISREEIKKLHFLRDILKFIEERRK